MDAPTEALVVEPRLTRHPHGITAIDTEYVRPGLAAAHLVQAGTRAAFVDVGTNASVPYLLAALDRIGVARQAVDYLFVTHVHLDHAGGAGRLLRELPNARAVAHPRGAPHLLAPDKLIAASRAVYGAATYDRLYGALVPIAAARMIVADDGQRFDLAGRTLECIHTPGHALHHHCIVDLAHAGIFTGDTFGLSYRALDTARGAFIVPTSTPTQFDPEQLVASIRRLLSYRPQAMYLMHYSRVTDVARLGADLEARVRQLVDVALRNAGAADPKAAIATELRGLWIEAARAHGCVMPDAEIVEVLGMDLDLNAQGLVAWLERQRRTP